MEAVTLFIIMLVVHWLADFIFQTHEMSINKSSSNKWLIKHTAVYTMVWTVVIALYSVYINVFGYGTVSFMSMVWFVLITFIAHTATDYIMSREVKKYFDKEDYHNGFVVIGIDQVLHYVQLILTYYLLYEN